MGVGDKIDLSEITSNATVALTKTLASTISGGGITFTADFDAFVFTDSVSSKSYIVYETTAQGSLATDLGTVEVVGIGAIALGTLAGWTVAGGIIAIA